MIVNSNCVCPPYLKKGDRIGILAPARKISREELAPALDMLREWGLEPILSKNIFQVENQYSGSDVQRASDLQSMLNDSSIKAILCARGGYGTLRIIDQIDFSTFVKNPKWMIGFSDVTVLHSHVHVNYGIQTLHAAMPITFEKDLLSLDSLKKALFGNLKEHIADNSSGFARKGSAEGILVGGNLSIVYALTGSASDLDTKGKILFIEDLDEYLYHIDRMVLNLKRSGKLDGLAGLIVGGMSDMKDNLVPFGKSPEEIIFDAVKEYSFPVAFNFPSGHDARNLALYFGRKVQLDAAEKVSLRFC